MFCSTHRIHGGLLTFLIITLILSRCTHCCLKIIIISYFLSPVYTQQFLLTCHLFTLSSSYAPATCLHSAVPTHLSPVYTQQFLLTCHLFTLSSSYSPVTCVHSSVPIHLSPVYTQQFLVTCHLFTLSSSYSPVTCVHSAVPIHLSPVYSISYSPVTCLHSAVPTHLSHVYTQSSYHLSPVYTHQFLSPVTRVRYYTHYFDIVNFVDDSNTRQKDLKPWKTAVISVIILCY
jgi:hypothetical protein